MNYELLLLFRKSRSFAALFCLHGKKCGSRQIPANSVAGNGKLCHGFALKTVFKKNILQKDRGRRGYQADWAVPLRRGGV